MRERGRKRRERGRRSKKRRDEKEGERTEKEGGGKGEAETPFVLTLCDNLVKVTAPRINLEQMDFGSRRGSKSRRRGEEEEKEEEKEQEKAVGKE